MSKRGGTSDVNGFISLGSSGKKPSKEKDKVVAKKTKNTVQRTKDVSQESTQKRTRQVETTAKAETSKTSENKKELKPIDVRENAIVSSVKRKDAKNYDAKNIKVIKPSSKRTSKPSTSSEKLPSGDPKIRSNTIPKIKDSVSSPYITDKTTKSSVVEKSPQMFKSSRSSDQSKNSPYKTSLAQKTQSRTSKLTLDDKTRKTSQLTETLKKKFSKPAAAKPSKSIAKPSPSKFNSTDSTKSKTSHRKLDSDILEHLECEEQAITFGEIPRSNTFTKENGDDKNSVSQKLASNSSITAPEEDNTYEDDFEDYESDFEDYVESQDSSLETTDEENGEESESTEEDEDVIGDGLIASTSKICIKETPIKLFPEETYEIKVAETNYNQNDKDKTLRVEEERKLDSGSYDMASNMDLRRKKQIQEVRAAIERENANLNIQKSHEKSSIYLEDEGFEEVDRDNFSIMDNSDLIDFSIAQKQQAKLKIKDQSKRRGELLMKMIKLDAMTFHHLDIPSVPYEVFMTCYGRSNTLQICTQTNDDALSEEIQTEEIETLSKWTQHPVKYSSPKSPEDMLSLFVQEKLGVGGESTIIQETDDFMPKLHVDSLRLHNFINTTGEIILALLEEREQDQLLKVNTKSALKKKDFGFSESYISLNVDKNEFLKDRPISLVCFSESNRSHILSVHKPSTKQPLTIQDESEGRCVLCVWSVHEPSSPRQTLVAANDVSAVCFHSHLVLAGLVDGALCLWDLREQSAIHCRSYLKQPSWLLRSPTYISTDLGRGKRHLSPVVSLRILPESNAEDGTHSLTQTPNQVVSLDEEGVLFIWTVVGSITTSQGGLNKSASGIDMGLAPWGRVRLVQSSQLNSLNAFPMTNWGMVQCHCMVVDRLRPSNLYIGTNLGQVAHCLRTSTRTRPQLYQPDQESKDSITCMDFSRCGHSLLMVGDRGGRVRVYHTQTARPLLDLSAAADANRPIPLLALQWSPSQPGLFFVLDAESCIHIWDLCISDMNPQMDVPFPRKKITSISLTASMLAIATEAGGVDIYNLKPQFGPLSEEDGAKQNNKFCRYISIL